jgi:hypothetical protein
MMMMRESIQKSRACFFENGRSPPILLPLMHAHARTAVSHAALLYIELSSKLWMENFARSRNFCCQQEEAGRQDLSSV